MNFRPEIKVLAPGDVDRVHAAALKILNETGVAFGSAQALAHFRDHGFKTDNETVFFTEKQVEDALALCPETYTFRARNAERSVTVGDMQHLVQPAFGCLYVQEPDKPRRPGVYADYIHYQNLLQASDNVHLSGGSPIVSSDIKAETRHLHQMYAALRYTDKPLIGWTADTHRTNEMLDMIEIAYDGQDVLESSHCMGTGINPLSPLYYGAETLESLLANAGRNQVLFVNPAAMAGITGPVDLMGTALMQNAEMLAGIVLIQLVRPKVPVVWCPASVVGYMKRASFCTGSPESLLINMVNLQLARERYRLPTRTLTGHTDAKIPDYQAGYETMQSILPAALGGAEIINQALGTLDSYMTLSFEKFILDEEIISRIQRIAAGVDTSTLDDCVRTIQEVGIRGDYLTHPSTFKNFRDLWMPSAADWESYDTWQGNGSRDAVTRAHEKYRQIIADAPETLLKPEVDAALRDYMRRKGAWI